MVGVTDKGAPIQDIAKQQRLHQVLTEMLGGEGSVVRHETVRKCESSRGCSRLPASVAFAMLSQA